MSRQRPQYKTQAFSVRVPVDLVEKMDSVLHPFETRSEFFRAALWRLVEQRAPGAFDKQDPHPSP